MNKKRIRVCLIIVILIGALWSMDMRLKTVTYAVKTDKVDKKVRIALLTDLHGCWYGKQQKNLIKAVERAKADVVLLGGDIFDDEVPYEKSEITVEQLAKKYPCYYVTGNHEYWSNDIDSILEIVEKCGVKTLSGTCDTIELQGETICICGIDDPDVDTYTKDGIGLKEQLEKAEKAADQEHFTVLLSHRPELAEMYQKYKFDLVLSGHAHGGQWRIPGILNGLFAPNQGILPKYAGGRYDFEGQTLIVSRGLARESTLAPRIFNRPELVIIELGPEG